MKKSYLLVSILILLDLLFIPNSAYAEEKFEIISEVTKYYKTITYTPSLSVNYFDLNSIKSNSVTYEITEEEYNSVEDNNLVIASNGKTETTYKRMTTSILTNGSYYRYKNELTWKNMPASRSYDIIGIGFFSTVKVRSNSTNFSMSYCYTDGSCYTNTTNYPQIFSNGAGTTFKLPTGELRSLNQIFYFDVEKNTTNTLNVQEVYGDYSHATSSILLLNAIKYTVNQSLGIVLDSSVSGYYDSMNAARAVWTGTW